MTTLAIPEIAIKQAGDFPPDLDALLSELNGNLAEMMAALEAGEITPIIWQARFEENLVRYHMAAYMAGQGSPDLNATDTANISRYATVQLEFLDNFRLVVQSAGEFQMGWSNRAAMYAGGIKKPYWKGKTKVLPLPAMPAEGTQCLDNCGCEWDIEVVDEDNGDYDAYWVRGKLDSCQTCLERAAQWAPLEIRGGRLLIPARMIGV